MRVQVERSGGFAGRTVRWAVDTDDLPTAAGEELRALVAAAPAWAGGAAASGSAAGSAAGGADRFGYRLRATDGGSEDAGELDLHFTEPPPPEAQRLLELVRDA